MENEVNHLDEPMHGLSDALVFLDENGDDDLRRFLRRMPMYAGNEDGPLTLSDLIYELKLVPFITTAWTSVKGGGGLAGQIGVMIQVIKTAEAALEKETGEKRRLKRNIDLFSFMQAYQSGASQ